MSLENTGIQYKKTKRKFFMAINKQIKIKTLDHYTFFFFIQISSLRKNLSMIN